jgi:hypothetical protein
MHARDLHFTCRRSKRIHPPNLSQRTGSGPATLVLTCYRNQRGGSILICKQSRRIVNCSKIEACPTSQEACSWPDPCGRVVVVPTAESTVCRQKTQERHERMDERLNTTQLLSGAIGRDSVEVLKGSEV